MPGSRRVSVVAKDLQVPAAQGSLDRGRRGQYPNLAVEHRPREVGDQGRGGIEANKAEAFVQRRDVAAGRKVREHVVALSQCRAQQSQPAGAVLLRDAPRTEIAYTLLSAIDLAIRVEGEEGTDDPAVGAQHEPVIGLRVGPSWIHGSTPRRRRDPRVHPALQKIRDRGHLGFGDRQYLDGTVARHGAKVRQTPRQQKSSTMTSIVIAAHNEATVIGRCLDTLLADAHPGEFDVTVVANGCSDRTAEVAGARTGVRVLDVAQPGKSNALNVGDTAAQGFPRIYLDADINASTEVARALVGALSRVRRSSCCGRPPA